MRLIVSDLACERGGRLLFFGLGFTVEEGGAALLTGPNGSGKTSLLCIIAGLLEPRAGEARLDGAAGETPRLADDAHLIGHRDGVKSQLTVGENLSFWRTMLGSPALSPEAALDTLGLPHLADTPSGYLSAGQRKRLALARLLVSRRPLWLLDEPTAALDAASRDLLARLMQRHLGTGGLIVAATHERIGLPGVEIRVGP